MFMFSSAIKKCVPIVLWRIEKRYTKYMPFLGKIFCTKFINIFILLLEYEMKCTFYIYLLTFTIYINYCALKAESPYSYSYASLRKFVLYVCVWQAILKESLTLNTSRSGPWRPIMLTCLVGNETEDAPCVCKTQAAKWAYVTSWPSSRMFRVQDF